MVMLIKDMAKEYYGLRLLKQLDLNSKRIQKQVRSRKYLETASQSSY